MRVRPDREEREFLRLPGCHLGEATAPVPGVHDEEAGEPVDVLLALRVPDVVALAAGDDRHAGLLQRRLPGEVHPEVVLGLLLQVGLVIGGCCGGGAVESHRVPQL
jgi:hypothetical protein